MAFVISIPTKKNLDTHSHTIIYHHILEEDKDFLLFFFAFITTNLI
jgi:hypothetical protein